MQPDMRPAFDYHKHHTHIHTRYTYTTHGPNTHIHLKTGSWLFHSLWPGRTADFYLSFPPFLEKLNLRFSMWIIPHFHCWPLTHF